jgi:hypothetical protein
MAPHAEGAHLMAPRYWTVTVDGRTVTVVAGTRAAAEKLAAQRMARGRPRRRTGPAP